MNKTDLFALGRRVERLIFGSIILIALCFIEAYISTANYQIVSDRKLRAITALHNQIVSSKGELDSLYKIKLNPPKFPVFQNEMEYQKQYQETRKLLGLPPQQQKDKSAISVKPRTYDEALSRIIDDLAEKLNLSRETLKGFVDFLKSPDDIDKNLQESKETFEKTPTNVWGVKSPQLVNLRYAGQEYQIQLGFLSNMLAIILAPLIIGWLGAIYMTRQRELVMIEKLENYKLAFPHLLNILPVVFVKINQNSYEYNPTKRPYQEMKLMRKLEAFWRYIMAFFRICAIEGVRNFV